MKQRTKICKCGAEFEPVRKFNSTLKSNKCFTCLANGQKHKELKEKVTDYSKLLQDNINKIVRLIDKGQPCLAKGIFPRQMHAGHVYARGGNSSIKLNLHNIHRQSAQSNHFQNEDGIFKDGIIKEYGQKYMSFISELRRTKALDYSNKQYKEFNELAKNIVKMLESKNKEYSLSERISLRNEINNTLEIYPREFCEFNL